MVVHRGTYGSDWVYNRGVAVVQVGDDVHDTLRDFANAHHVSQVQLIAALVRRLHRGKIDVMEAVEEARSIDTANRRKP